MILRYVLLGVGLFLLATLSTPFGSEAPSHPGGDGPYAVGHTQVTTINPDTHSELKTDVYYPARMGEVNPGGAAYAALVFAPGTMVPAIIHAGNAQHLASWGYVVAVPGFPDDDIEVRGSDTSYLLSYLEAENATADSRFYQRIDPARLGVAGHSLGGTSSLLVAARDERVVLGAVVHDPVNPTDNYWDHEAEGPAIRAPIALIGAPAHICNWFAKYNKEYPSFGAMHKAKFVIEDGSHCDFLDAEPRVIAQICGQVCGRVSEERLELVERYTTAWLNYYVRLDTDAYAYLYGEEADEDIEAGRISRELHTAPHGVTATGKPGAVELGWTLYDHPIIDGYNVYRSRQSGEHPGTPYAQVGRVSSYVDANVLPGQRYYYRLRSRDAAGNEHQASEEVGAVPLPGAPGRP